MICKPYKTAKLSDISQSFGVNPQPYQPNGHTGVDFCAPYGTFLVAPENCKVIRIVKAESVDTDLAPLSRGYGIQMQSVSNPERTHLYWHCLPVFPVSEGDIVLQGQPIAQMGNSGFVMFAGNVVPVEVRTNAPYSGTHLHQEIKISGEYVDPLKDMDFSIPIKYDLITTIKVILNKITNLIKK